MASSYSLEAPFSITAVLSLEKADKLMSYIPSQPTVYLDQTTINTFLTQELNTPILDKLYLRL